MKKIGFWVALIAGITAITGYSLKDFVTPEKASPSVVESNSVHNELESIEVPTTNPTEPAPNISNKPDINVEVHDQGKVGNIITGDSNTMEIKQEF